MNARNGTIMTEPVWNIEVLPATKEQESILDNLLQLYAQDFREFHLIPLDENGRFHYKQLPLYWSDPQRYAFLVKMNDAIAGFVLAKKGSEVSGNNNAWDMAEFFVMREFRRRGIGIQVAHKVWKLLPGPWEVRVMEANTSAVAFWAKAISLFAGEAVEPIPLEKDAEAWKLFRFHSK